MFCVEAAPCSDSDWRTGFSVCTEEPDGGKRRGVFAYAPPGVCNPSDGQSRPLPEPLLGQPCDVLCDAGTQVSVELVPPEPGQSSSPAQLQLGCKPCSTGFFSLGGGLLLDGDAGDWNKPWPVNLQTYCFYRDQNFEWQRGTETPRFCVLHLGPTGTDRSSDLVVETRPATWDEQLVDLDLSLPMVLPSAADVLACQPFSGDLSRFEGVAVLVLRGDCTFQQKAENAHAAGAAAVVVYNNIPNDGYFFPAAADTEHLPQTPFFMITMEDGLEWKEAIQQAEGTGETLHLHVPSTHCRASAREALPESYRDNSTDEELREESWMDRIGGLGCAEWAADPGGGFLHSGSNLHFHQVVTVLEMEALFVRDGYFSFQYSVDSEDTYDGLIFYLDDVAVFSTSRADPYKTYTVDIKRGPHSFIWTYNKDGSTTVREDRARIRLIEVVGTAHADYQCWPCSSGVGPLAAAQQCGVCGHGTYLSTGTLEADGSTSCLPCPRGTWSLPGAVGEEACQRRRACERMDVEVTYTAVEELSNGSSRELPGRHCHGGRSLVRHRLKEPSTCDLTHPDSVSLQPDSMEACPECQPHMSRPNGEDCVAEVMHCDAGSYPVRELVISRWQVWPKNVSTEIWGGLGTRGGSSQGTATSRASADPFHRSWQLAPLSEEGAAGEPGAVVVGSAFTAARDAALAAQRGGHVDASLLHLDVVLEAPGELRFTFQMEPAGRWGSLASLLVDGSPAVGLSVPTTPSAGPQQASLPELPAGRHRLTWKWQYIEGASDGGAQTGSGVRISSISVTNAQDAPPSLCSRCPPGQQITVDGLACRACPAGRSSTDYSAGGAGQLGSSCSECPAGRAAGEGQAACTQCGAGLHSGVGASACSLASMVQADVSATDPRTWDMQVLQETWTQAASLLSSGSASRDAGAAGLVPLRVEDRVFYLSPFALGAHPGGHQQAAEDGITEAYWWEQVLPFGNIDAGALSEALRTCERAWVLAVGDKLEGYEPVVQDGGILGIAAVFTGLCDEEVTGQESGPRVRRSRLFFRCDLDADTLVDAAAESLAAGSSGGGAGDLGGAMHLPELSLLHGGVNDAGALSCVDLALEWRSRAACPLCRRSDWVRVQAHSCKPGKGRQVSYVASVPCVGGAPQPADEWEPCGEISGAIIAGIVGGACVAVALMCSTIVYVVLLRKRYRKYMELELPGGPNPTTPTVMGSSL